MPTTNTRCPECIHVDWPDNIAIHLIDAHHWEVDKASIWLREQVEAEAFNDEP